MRISLRVGAWNTCKCSSQSSPVGHVLDSLVSHTGDAIIGPQESQIIDLDCQFVFLLAKSACGKAGLLIPDRLTPRLKWLRCESNNFRDMERVVVALVDDIVIISAYFPDAWSYTVWDFDGVCKGMRKVTSFLRLSRIVMPTRGSGQQWKGLVGNMFLGLRRRRVTGLSCFTNS